MIFGLLLLWSMRWRTAHDSYVIRLRNQRCNQGCICFVNMRKSCIKKECAKTYRQLHAEARFFVCLCWCILFVCFLGGGEVGGSFFVMFFRSPKVCPQENLVLHEMELCVACRGFPLAVFRLRKIEKNPYPWYDYLSRSVPTRVLTLFSKPTRRAVQQVRR